ncbi:MAG: PH domain-containing protein [Chloroflexi bacterium]|nr:PH domain-containing protein [Chloroflexota bacterium]
MGYLERLLGENEAVVFKTRQHWIVIIGSVLFNSLLFLIILGAAVSLTGLTQNWSILLLLFLIYPGWKLILDIANWWNEVYVVTNRRVIQLEGIFNKHSIDSSLEKVNDVVLDQSVLGRLLDYGRIEILTASEAGRNIFHRVARPVLFKTTMLNQKAEMEQGGEFPARAKAPTEADIPRMISELDELRKKGLITAEEFEREKAQLLEKLGK